MGHDRCALGGRDAVAQAFGLRVRFRVPFDGAAAGGQSAQVERLQHLAAGAQDIDHDLVGGQVEVELDAIVPTG